MRYPTITRSVCERHANAMQGGALTTAAPEVAWLGTGESVDLGPAETLARRLKDEIRELDPKADRDKFEGEVAADLYRALEAIPADVLDDPGFWRYLALVEFWDFIAWREEKPFARGNHMKYVDALAPFESVLNRMYLRAKSVGGDHLHLAGALAKAGDFWRSHVIRVRTGTAPALTRAFVEMQSEERLMTNPLRETARSLNRTWSNIVLHLYEEDEARELLNELRPATDDETPAPPEST